MKFFRNLIVLLAFPASALYFTNPDESDFKEFLTLYVQDELADNVPGETELGRKFRKGLGQLASAAAGPLAKREDLRFASIYTMEIAGERHAFVGVAGQFFPLKKH